MRQIPPFPLWVGNAGDRADPRRLHAIGIRAIVDLAIEEPPAPVARELAYCRLPLMDGAANPSWMVRVAVETVASLLRTGTPTLLCCSAGMSRSPCVAAGAISLLSGTPPQEALRAVVAGAPCDISGGFWQ